MTSTSITLSLLEILFNVRYIFLTKITQFCQRTKNYIFNIKGKSDYNECNNLAGINYWQKSGQSFDTTNLVTVDLNKSENKSDRKFAHSQYDSNVLSFSSFL